MKKYYIVYLYTKAFCESIGFKYDATNYNGEEAEYSSKLDVNKRVAELQAVSFTNSRNNKKYTNVRIVTKEEFDKLFCFS